MALIRLWCSSGCGTHQAVALIRLWRSSACGTHQAVALIRLWCSSGCGTHQAVVLIRVCGEEPATALAVGEASVAPCQRRRPETGVSPPHIYWLQVTSAPEGRATLRVTQ